MGGGRTLDACGGATGKPCAPGASRSLFAVAAPEIGQLYGREAGLLLATIRPRFRCWQRRTRRITPILALS